MSSRQRTEKREKGLTVPLASTATMFSREVSDYEGWESGQKDLADQLRRRQFYRDHPATLIPPVDLPASFKSRESDCLAWIEGELTLFVKFDPCQTWSAHLVRRASIGTLETRPGEDLARVSALFEAKISGGATREKAIEAVVAAACLAGWLRG